MTTNGKHGKSIAERSIRTTLLMDTLRPAEFVSYADLTKACGADVQDEGRGSLQSAIRALRREERLLFVIVPREGVKRGGAVEAVACGMGSAKKIHREAKRGFDKLTTADPAKMGNEERIQYHTAASVLGTLTLMTAGKSIKQLEAPVKVKQERLSLPETFKVFGG